ncbi:MAG: flagellar basal body rod protein FlgC [Porticoccaceae bacterium]
MGLFNVFDVSGSALTAQSVRLNTISSNLANAEVVSSSEEAVYRAKYPYFSTVFDEFGEGKSEGVKVERVVTSQVPPRKEYQPSHPMADEQGYIYMPNVNLVEEMANMISASRSYQSNVEAMNTAKQLIVRTLSLGR